MPQRSELYTIKVIRIGLAWRAVQGQHLKVSVIFEEKEPKAINPNRQLSVNVVQLPVPGPGCDGSVLLPTSFVGAALQVNIY